MSERKRVVRVGMIGCGSIFKRHAEAVSLNRERIKLVALCDIDEKRVCSYAAEFDVRGFTDYLQMLEEMRGKMDLVAVTSPNQFHFDQTIASLRRGYNVLVEKPVDTSSKRAIKISDEAHKLGRKAFAVLQVRYHKSIDAVHEALSQGLIGRVRSVSLVQRWQRPEEFFNSWRSEANAHSRILYDVGIHYLDIVQLMFGLPEVKSTHIFSNKHTKLKFEDTVFSILRFPSGASGSIEITVAAEPRNIECSLSIMGSGGYIKLGGKALEKIESALFSFPQDEESWEKIISSKMSGESGPWPQVLVGSAPNHPILYREMIEGRGIPISEAVNSIKFIEAIYRKVGI